MFCSRITTAKKKALQVFSNLKVVLTCFFYFCGIVYHNDAPESQTNNKKYYPDVLCHLPNADKMAIHVSSKKFLAPP